MFAQRLVEKPLIPPPKMKNAQRNLKGKQNKVNALREPLKDANLTEITPE